MAHVPFVHFAIAKTTSYVTLFNFLIDEKYQE